MKTALDTQVQDYTPDKQQAHDAWVATAAQAKTAGMTPPRAPRNPDPVQNQHNPTVLYNGMIAGIVPYGIKGALWQNYPENPNLFNKAGLPAAPFQTDIKSAPTIAQ